MTRPDTAGDIEFLGYDIVPDTVNGLDIEPSRPKWPQHLPYRRTYTWHELRMAHSLVLLKHRLVRLRK